MNLTSFISEHTAEFYLLPPLLEELKKRFTTVIPFFYWRTREGTLHLPLTIKQAKLVVLYPRRPKIPNRGEGVFMKINHLLFEHASFAAREGLPIYVGMPVASSMADLGRDPHCRWFRLHQGWEEILLLNSDEKIRTGGVEEIDLTEMVDMVVSKNPLMSMDQIRQNLWFRPENSYQLMFGNRYKPVYILLIE